GCALCMPFISPFRSPFRPYNRAYTYRGLTASAPLFMAVSDSTNKNTNPWLFLENYYDPNRASHCRILVLLYLQLMSS
ncbi:MAG: hypothetical protein KZQ60_07630, partial [Candidatus Thiodiazotropha sp. (ex Lucinoma aequizonata)]|nr:hypothetical protein [Candidatus Thiodiazotropha sp. (ex Lucinoma aequizonata)]